MANYGTVIGADAYHAARANAAWAGTDAAKLAALVRASAWIDANYRTRPKWGPSLCRFPGTKTGGRAQELEWPRTDAADAYGNDIASNVVPSEVDRATYEAALVELVTPGALTPAYVASAQAKREKVGPIEVEYREAEAVNLPGNVGLPPSSPVFPLIDGILAPLLLGASDGPYIAVV